MFDRIKIVNQAESWMGCNEYDGSHKKIIDLYNKHKPLARNYKVSYKDAWCAVFVSAVAIACEYTTIIPTECGCQEMIEKLKKIGEWIEDDSYVPAPGDIIFYDWNDSDKGDNTGWADHVGIVCKVSGNIITVIEGNYSDCVKKRTLSVNGQYIRGYGVPKYDSIPVEIVPEAVPEDSLTAKSHDLFTVTGKGAPSEKVKYKAKVNVNSSLNVRFWAGTENKTCSFSPLKPGTEVGVCDAILSPDGKVWYFIDVNGKKGFVHSKYIKR